MRKLRKRTVHPHCDAAYRYAKDVLRGKIVVCELTKLACSRFMKDLDDKRWNFNRDRAERFCDFVELMPHVKGKWAGTPLKLEPWQSFIFVNLYGFEDKETGLRRFRRSFVFVPRKNGKGLALDTPIPTPDGWTTMGDLRVGDTLYAEDGSECTVTFVSNHRELDCYEIAFANGEKIVCDGDHLWETQSRYSRTPKVRDTRSMFCAQGAIDNFEIPILGAPSIPLVAIQKVDTVKTKCIQVDSANSLFLCGRTMIPTHNTSISAPLGLGMLTIEAEPGSEVYCLEPSTPVLFGDFIWRPISEVKVGDTLIGFDEKASSPRKYRKYRPTIVEKKTSLIRPCMKIIFEDGRYVISSLDHSWLTPHTGRNNKNGWKETRDLQVGNSIRYFGEPWGPPLDSFDAGYVSGFFDSEGCIGNGWNKERAGFRLSASQRPNVVLEKVKDVLNKYGVAFSPDRLCKQDSIIRFDIQSAYECFRFLGLFQPKRLIERSEQLYNGRAFNRRQKWRKILAIEDVGEMEVVAIKTSTGTFLADGLCSHNCGATRESQADEVFRPAKAMAERARGFKGVYGITVAASAIHREMGMSFFKRLIGKPGEGQSPYCAIHDEYHEHPTSEQVDSMDTGMGARQEPLQFIITTAGTDTSSPCKDMYDYACKVLDGSFENEQFFALIYGIDAHPRDVVFDFIYDAVCAVERVCTCQHAKIALIKKLLREDFAEVATQKNIEETKMSGTRKEPRLENSGGVKTTQIDQQEEGVCALPVTSSTYSTATQKEKSAQVKKEKSGQKKTGNPVEPHIRDGETTAERQKCMRETLSDNMGYPCPILTSSSPDKGDGAPFAEDQISSSALTIAMKRGLSEDYCVKNAIAESDYSGIMRLALGGHSLTCRANSLKFQVDGKNIKITHPPDDWTDFDVWKKANPNLGVSISEDYLRGKLQEAIQRTSLQNTVKTKHLNVWCNVGVGWMNMAKWVENANPLMRLEDFKGSKAWIGIDLASKVDLTAMMILIFHESRFYLFGKYYLPSETVELKGNEHYQRWALDGILTSTPGARTDYGYLEDDLKAVYNLLEVQEVVYDPREAEYLMQNIREQVSCPVVEFIQSAAQLSEPMKEFEAQYLAGNLIHTGDPVLAWSASNVVLRENRNKLYYPCKERQENKIDPIVAAIMAMARAKAGIEDLATQGFVEL